MTSKINKDFYVKEYTIGLEDLGAGQAVIKGGYGKADKVISITYINYNQAYNDWLLPTLKYSGDDVYLTIHNFGSGTAGIKGKVIVLEKA